MYFFTTGNVLGRSEGQQRVQHNWRTVHEGTEGAGNETMKTR